MIRGIGCDIIKVSRIKESVTRLGDKFLERIYTELEIEKAPKTPQKKFTYLASRFAAKEAFAKALGTGIGETIEFKEIEILKLPSGKPYLNFPRRLGRMKAHLSMSDDSEYAMATVVIEVDE